MVVWNLIKNAQGVTNISKNDQWEAYKKSDDILTVNYNDLRTSKSIIVETQVENTSSSFCISHKKLIESYHVNQRFILSLFIRINKAKALI